MPRVCIGKNPGWFALAHRKGGSIPRFPDVVLEYSSVAALLARLLAFLALTVTARIRWREQAFVNDK
jgi:hypothetical protein